MRRVRLVVDTFLENPDADQDNMLGALVGAGLSPRDAWRSYQLIPIAFVHVAFESHGVQFEPAVQILESSDPEHRHREVLAGEPIYVAAKQLATLRPFGEVTTVAQHSAEWAAIADLAAQGSPLDDIVLVEPLLLAFDERWQFPPANGEESSSR